MSTREEVIKDKILKQVQFYFGDVNYPKDHYLRQMAISPDGRTPIRSIAQFKKMIAITTDVSIIVDALRCSPNLVVDEDGMCVRRKIPYRQEQQIQPRRPNTKIITLEEELDDKTFVRVRNYKLNSENISSFCDKLLETSTITKIDLRRNTIGAQGARQVANILVSESCSINDIFLFHNSLGDEGASILAEALKTNTSLTKLNLCENEIGCAGAQALGQMLLKNTSLTALDLNNNKFGDEGANALLLSLKHNTTLKSISMWNTGISDTTAQRVLELKRDNRTIEKITLSDREISKNLVTLIKSKK